MTDFSPLFVQNIPLIDVRAPVEFADGHFPRSVNLPLMEDEERRQVGIEYKGRGQAAAVELGHRLVSGSVKSARVERWREFVRANPTARLYCFRGGLRSQISAQWLREAGTEIEIVPGGYKALRRFLLEALETLPSKFELMILAGRTGVGKTRFLREAGLSTAFLDLEQLARHRGSAFGATGPLGTQPAQVTFENAVAVELLKLAALSERVIVEDESRSIGAVQVPANLFAEMGKAPLIVLEKTFEERVGTIVQDYVLEKAQSFGGDWSLTRDFFVGALDRIARKLGGLNYQRIRSLMLEAFDKQEHTSSPGALLERHSPWVEELLKHYYDPLYDASLKRKAARVRFQGDERACLEFLKNMRS